MLRDLADSTSHERASMHFLRSAHPAKCAPERSQLVIRPKREPTRQLGYSPKYLVYPKPRKHAHAQDAQCATCRCCVCAYKRNDDNMHHTITYVISTCIVCDTSVHQNLEPNWFQNLIQKMTSDFQFSLAEDLGFGHVCIPSLWHKQARRQTNNRTQSRRQAVKHATKQPTHPHTRAEQHAAK